MFLNCPKLISTCRSSGGRSFQILGPATEKSLSPVMMCATLVNAQTDRQFLTSDTVSSAICARKVKRMQ